MPDLNETVEAAAAAPKSYSVDGETIVSHSLTELQDIADRQQTDEVVKKPRRGLLLSKVRFPGMQ